MCNGLDTHQRNPLILIVTKIKMTPGNVSLYQNILIHITIIHIIIKIIRLTKLNVSDAFTI